VDQCKPLVSGKAALHVSGSWDAALAQNDRQREEVAAVSTVGATGGAAGATAAAAATVGGGEGGVFVQEAGAFNAAAAAAAAAAEAAEAAAAAEPGVPSVGTGSSLIGEEQGSAKWHALRATRLTASAFSNALGFWYGPARQNLLKMSSSEYALPPIFIEL